MLIEHTCHSRTKLWKTGPIQVYEELYTCYYRRPQSALDDSLLVCSLLFPHHLNDSYDSRFPIPGGGSEDADRNTQIHPVFLQYSRGKNW